MAGGQLGQSDGSGSAIEFNHPTGLAVDASGTIYVADTGNRALRIITSTGISTSEYAHSLLTSLPYAYGALTGLAADPNGDLLIVAPGYIFRRSATPSSPLSIVYTGSPTAVAVDASEAIYFADSGQAGVQRIDPTTHAITMIAGSTAVSGLITGLAVDPSGSVYVNIEAAAQQNGVYKIAGGIATALMRGGGLTNYATFNGLSLDASGNIFATIGPYDQPLGDLDTASYSEIRFQAAGASNQSYSVLRQYYHYFPSQVGTGIPMNEPVTGIAADTTGNFYYLVGDILVKVTPVTSGAIPPPAKKTEVTANSSTVLTVPAEVQTLSFRLNNYMDVQWLKNGAPIAGATTVNYTISFAQPTDAGIYTFVETDNIGTTNYSIALGVDTSPGETYLLNWGAAAVLPSTKRFTSLAYDGSRFMAAAIDGSLFTSPDGTIWSTTGTVSTQVNSLIAAGPSGGFLGVGNGGLVFSASGPAYSPVSLQSASSNVLTGIAVGNGAAVAVGFNGTTLLAHNGNLTWTASASGTQNQLNAVAFGNGRFVAVGLNSTVISSNDGQNWTQGLLGSNANLASVAYGPASFVAIGADTAGNSLIFTSPDGITWTPQPPLAMAAASSLVRVVSANGAIVAVGSGAVAVSTDGGFTWTVTNPGTSSTLEGIAFGLGRFLAVGDQGTVSQTAVAQSHLANLSSSGFVGSGANNLVVGFTIGGLGSKQVLFRGIGPSLAEFGVTGTLALPQLTLFNGNSVPIASNAGWAGSPSLAAVFTQVGAFALPVNSNDAAITQTLPVGGGTAQVSGANDSTGVSLAEIYDADLTTSASRLINLSARAQVGAAAVPLVAGFVISGNTAETVLLRGIGPGLSQFGLSGTLNTPALTLYNHSGAIVASNSGWGGSALLSTAFSQVGAFSLPVGSADAALLQTLAPGNYTAQLSNADSTAGLGMVEIYEVPNGL